MESDSLVRMKIGDKVVIRRDGNSRVEFYGQAGVIISVFPHTGVGRLDKDGPNDSVGIEFVREVCGEKQWWVPASDCITTSCVCGWSVSEWLE